MRKLHPSSIVVRSLSRSLNVGFLFFIVGVLVSPGGAGANLLTIGAMVLAGILLAVVYELAYYRRFRYELTDDTFDVTSGVLSRRNREVPLRRVQNVDVRQNVLQRTLGIAAVHVETAGGGQTEVSLRFVARDEAKRLQRQLGNGPAADAVDDAERPGVDEPAAVGEPAGRRRSTGTDDELLFEIERKELVILSVFTIDPGASLLATIALSFASGFDPTTLVPVDAVEQGLPGAGLIALAWVVLVFLLVAWILSATLTFNRYYGFRLVRVGDELHYERGLFQRYSGTIPLDKVQTVTIKESVPFRWFGYASLAVETAGYAPGQSGSRGTESAVPLAERDRALSLARSVEPFGSESVTAIPPRARERYAVRYTAAVGVLVAASYLLARYTTLVENWYAAAGLLVLVPVAAHLKWRSRGYRASDRYFLARTGFWRRTTKVVPYYRVQAVIDTRTIFQRRRRLASVTADTASSASFFGRAATALDVDQARGRELRRTIEERLQEQLLERSDRRVFDTVATGRGDEWTADGSDATREEAGDSGTTRGDVEAGSDRDETDDGSGATRHETDDSGANRDDVEDGRDRPGGRDADAVDRD